MTNMQAQLLSPAPAADSAHRDAAGAAFDLRSLVAADGAALEDFYDGFHPQRAAQSLPPSGRIRIARWLQAILPTGVHLLAWRGGTLIGHALVVPTTRVGVGEYAVFLHQSERGKGIGAELTRAAVASARKAGFIQLWLTVEPANRAAVRTYERVGFRFRPATRLSSEAEMTLDLAA
ncbi:MAG: GNAT family N-acetyltransferase [Gemmatimonadetes bacterium]|nr:GNAT family N-acetyltransferase [Gemmatimonadota bacterium]